MKPLARSLCLCLILVSCLTFGCGRWSSTGGQSVEEVKNVDPSQLGAADPIEVGPADWPWWRGPAQDNHAVGDPPPVNWTESENIVWRADVPGRGHASPTVCRGNVFVVTADPTAETMTLLCLDRASGDRRWSSQLHAGGFMHTDHKNSHASATPACDGNYVFTAQMVNDGITVSAVDQAGQIKWQTAAGPFQSLHGYGSSPVIYQALVIVAADNPGTSFLAALHRKTGDIVWRVKRKNSASFGSPIITKIDGKDQLLLHGHQQITSYDPSNGQLLWTSDGPSDTAANTMAFSSKLVLATGGFPQRKLMAVRNDGSGTVVWQHRLKAYVPSPLVVDGRLFVVHDDGVARCFDVASGKRLWQQRLDGDFTASPIVAGDLIFVPNEAGKMFVFKASDVFEPVAENTLTPGGMASPVICGGQLFLRTDNHLYCIAAPAPAA